jgi:hypothetical protein
MDKEGFPFKRKWRLCHDEENERIAVKFWHRSDEAELR